VFRRSATCCAEALERTARDVKLDCTSAVEVARRAARLRLQENFGATFVKRVTSFAACSVGLILLGAGGLFRSETLAHPAGDEMSMTTLDRVRTHGIWPTKGAAAAEEFVGDSECAKCHTAIAQTQATTAMRKAPSPADTSQEKRNMGL
jgi:hypothetical protein